MYDLPPSAAQETTSPVDAVRRSKAIDISRWRGLPLLRGSAFRADTSADREREVWPSIPARNKDFNNFLAVCDRPALREQWVDGRACEPEISGYVIAASDDGPGVISRLFFTGLSSGSERLRLYLDDLREPAIDVAVQGWRDGAPFAPPLAVETSGAQVSYVPIVYRKRFRAVLDALDVSSLIYYQVDHNCLPADVLQGTGLMPLTAALEIEPQPTPDARTALRQLDLQPGARAQLLSTEQAGTLERLRVRLSTERVSALEELVLSARWDGAEDPAMELSLAALFGVWREPAAYSTSAMSVALTDSAVELSLSLPMPFAQGAQLELSYAGEAVLPLEVELVLGPELRGSYGRLHAQPASARAPLDPGARYTLADLRGHGKYVGAVLRASGAADASGGWPWNLSFLEGDDLLSVDGELIAHGTGTEDHFNGGWYFSSGPYSSPYSALLTKTDAPDASVSMQRWQLQYDAVEFERELQLRFEYGNDDPQTVRAYDSVAFYYLLP